MARLAQIHPKTLARAAAVAAVCLVPPVVALSPAVTHALVPTAAAYASHGQWPR